MEKSKIKVGEKTFDVVLAITDEERNTGLSNVESMDSDEGMLFVMPDGQQEVVFTMEDMSFPLDLIFFNQDLIAYQIVSANAGDKEPIVANPGDGQFTKYVLEVNFDSGIQLEEKLILEIDEDIDDVDEDDPDIKMYVLDPEGNPIMDLFGGERIVSRRETLVLIKKAKVADREKSDNKYKSLGKYLFKVFDGQDNRDPEYVTSPKNEQVEIKKGED